MTIQDPRHLLVRVVDVLETLDIPYIVTGGIAVLVWGRPRFTADIDLVVDLVSDDIEALDKALNKISDDAFVEKDAIKRAVKNKGEFNFIDTKSGIKVDFWVADTDDPFNKSRIERRIERKISGKSIFFSSPEDLILIKLQWYKISPSARQLEDVESVLKISGKKLDFDYLNKWAERMSTKKYLQQVSRKPK